MLSYDRRLKPCARQLRAAMTDAERVLWSRVRRKQVGGVVFYRQKPLGRYVVDFYAPAAGLVVEVDGSQHFSPEGSACDQTRDAYLRSLGLLVLRFDNRQVLTETEGVMSVLERAVTERVGELPGR